ncbi:TPA: hypothetical protein PFD71_003105 [Vibrio cholerae]|uniref:hypothetical protein n=1 Tax=Vibrio cholerae TaxID=666 RepID=UPI002060AB8C|nr:hypothetical protein 1992IndM4_0325 [Vibrio phage ICP1]HDG1611215.1 hypothetical protein [Vibrio cholerae]QVV97472.1 hypothetical protein 2017DRC106_0355 [Vibrio phage ICP1]QVV97699.1 hypothetical protein 2017DRC32_0355 [Vibrio phage ICP1]QVV97926.1 hypothetical protein 2017DRC48_0355 [Vibrio phage ICP1]
MAIQDLKEWCQIPKVDDVTEIEQVRPLVDEEFINGWQRQQTVSTQQVNQLFKLLTNYAPPSPTCIYYQDSSIPVNSVSIIADGRTFTQEEAPELFEIYGGTMPDKTVGAPAGTTPIMRKR